METSEQFIRLLRYYENTIKENGLNLSFREIYEGFHSVIFNQRYIVYEIIQNDISKGFILFEWLDKEKIYARILYLLPEYRGKMNYLDIAEDYLKEIGFKGKFLADCKEEAINKYKKRGFKVDYVIIEKPQNI